MTDQAEWAMAWADGWGRRKEVRAAFIEGFRRGSANMGSSAKDAWATSRTLARLGYGVFPPCPKCRCMIVNVEGMTNGYPSCMGCGTVRTIPTTQHRARSIDPFEKQRVGEILRHAVTDFGSDPEPR